MRPASAIELKVSDVRDAVKMDKPYLVVGFDDDKTLTEHYVPLHPDVVKVLAGVIDGKADNEPLFTSYTLLQRLLKEHPTPMINQSSLKVEVRDLRKFMIQKSKVELKLNPDILNYIVSHNLGSLDWKYYQNFKAEVFYDEYMASWGPVNLLDDIVGNEAEDFADEINYSTVIEDLTITEGSLTKEIQYSLDSIKEHRDGIDHLNGLLPPDRRLPVDTFLPTIDNIKDLIKIRLEGLEDKITTKEEYDAALLEELAKEADRVSDQAHLEKIRYQQFRRSITV